MNFCIKNIRIGIFWTCQVIFWLTPCFAVLNRIRDSVGVDNYFVAALLGCWVSVIFLLLHVLRSDTALAVFAARNWLAAILLGVLFQAGNFSTYISIIVVTEIIWQFLLRKRFAKKILPEKNKRQSEIDDNANLNYKNNESVNPDIESKDEKNATDKSDSLLKSDWESGKTQHIIRSKTESGGEKLEGYFLVEFDENQLTVSVHVPFYPVFEQTPKVEAYLIDDTVDAKLTIAKTQFFGARIDVKRTNKNVNNLRLTVIVLG